MDTVNKAKKDETQSVLKAAWLIALVTIASKFMGFVRDMVVANYYGATLVSDAYFYALQIPSLAIIILGGMGTFITEDSEMIKTLQSEMAENCLDTFLQGMQAIGIDLDEMIQLLRERYAKEEL